MKKILKIDVVLAAVIFALLVIGCSDTSGANSDAPIVSPDGMLEDISSLRPDYQGIVIKIDDTNIPENVSKRRIYVSHKNYLGEVYDRAVALYDNNYPNNYTLVSEWGYPFVNVGTKYKIIVKETLIKSQKTQKVW